ncbi:MAG: phosphoribosyltransferase family protein [Acidimicrobiia bacterium]|nr:phosphoribosyltransferase family protein [Acidimicrobiia bacterium]
MRFSRRPHRFADRAQAGDDLADLLAEQVSGGELVLGLPRGGVVVAAAVADRLGAELDALGVAKVGAPGRPELAAGAVGEGGVVHINDYVVARLGLRPGELDAAVSNAAMNVASKMRAIRAAVPAVSVAGRSVIIVDDGLATGATAHAAIAAVRSAGAAHVTLAVPVAPDSTVEELESEADEVVVLLTPTDFTAVGMWYENFDQTEMDEVVGLLQAARQ